MPSQKIFGRLLSDLPTREEYIAPIPEAERKDMMLAYHAQLNSADEETRLKAAKAWAKWEYVTLSSLATYTGLS